MLLCFCFLSFTTFAQRLPYSISYGFPDTGTDQFHPHEAYAHDPAISVEKTDHAKAYAPAEHNHSFLPLKAVRFQLPL